MDPSAWPQLWELARACCAHIVVDSSDDGRVLLLGADGARVEVRWTDAGWELASACADRPPV